jgi:6-pyruvoyltetrahydropterin/6-carboxytetrahydropterin synthase
MLTLTREVRCTIPLHGGPAGTPANGLAGNLVDGPGIYLVLQVTLAGDIHPHSSYVENIKTIDDHVRSRAVPAIGRLMAAGRYTLANAVGAAGEALARDWENGKIHRVRIEPHPYLSCWAEAPEWNMVYLTQRFEFSAAHRLHNPSLSEEENRRLFGKCNNPAGHGHNYEFEVTLTGLPDAAGQLINPETFAQVVNETVVVRFDHKHLNQQTAEFAATIPSVENIARVIYELLTPKFAGTPRLHGVTVWETPKTSASWGFRLNP